MSDVPVTIYDIEADRRRPVTQADVDLMQQRLLWMALTRNIVGALTEPNAYQKITQGQLGQIAVILRPIIGQAKP